MSSIVPGSGKVLKHAKLVLIFWGAGWARSPVISAEELAGVFSAILATPYMAKMAQYNGICNATIIHMALDTSKEFTEQYHNTPVFHSSELPQMIAGHIDGDGAVPAPSIDPDLLYIVISELSVVCRETADPPVEAAGLHDKFDHNGARFHYAWVSNDGSLTSGNMIPKEFVHELVEACSDPDLDSFHVSDDNEIGDKCNGELVTMPKIRTPNAPDGIVIQSYFSALDNACVLPTEYSLKFWAKATQKNLGGGLRKFLPQGGSVRSLLACGNIPPPAGFGIVVSHQNDQLGGELIVEGTHFTPGGRAFISINYIPTRTVSVQRNAYVKSDGTFRFAEEFKFVSTNPQDAAIGVWVTAIDVATGNLVSEETSASIWVS